MKTNFHIHTRLPYLGACLLLSLGLPLAAAEQEAAAPGAVRVAPDSKANEGWRIVQRQKWFAESRSLLGETNARSHRDESVRSLQVRSAAMRQKAMANGETWVEMGPSSMNMSGWSMGRVSGRNNAIVPHPQDDNTLYFGSAAGGVWKTTDGGTNWTPIFDQVGTMPIGSIALAPQDPNQVWVGTGDKNGGGCSGYFGQGVFMSSDAGQTWQAKNGSGETAMPLSIVNGVAVAPLNSQVILAGGLGACDAGGVLNGGGLYRSSDGGNSWNRVLSGKVEDIAFVPGSNTVYATSAGVGLFKSTDGGATWANTSNGMTIGTGRMRMAIAPSNPQVMYVLMGSALYRSANGGASWSAVNNAACEGQCSYNLALAVHPTDPDKILVGSIRFALSTNGGTRLTTLTSGWGTSQKVHQDTHVLVWSKNNPGRFWVGSDGGIWRSDDSGANFINMNSNLNVTQFYDVAVDFSSENRMFGGAQDNSSLGRTTSKVWGLTYASGDGFMNAIDPSNTNTVLQTSYPSGSYPSIVRSTTGGAGGSYKDLPTTGLSASANFPWVTPLATAGSKVWVASDTLYVGTTSASNFSWNALSGNMGSAATVITPKQVGSNYIAFVGTSGGKIFYSGNAATAGSAVSDVTGNYPGGRVSDIAIDPTSNQRVFVTRAGFGASRLYRSNSGGTSWTAVGNGLPNVPANSVAIDPLNAQRVFVGTDIGVYESADGGDNFVPFSTGLPLGVVVQDLEINANPHVMVAATYGRGAWKVALQGGTMNQAPVSKFSASPSQLNVSFTDQSTDVDGSVVSRSWNFGDASYSTEQNPVHAYATAGTYTVSLTVTDNSGATNSSSQTITVTGGAACTGTSLTGNFSGATNQSQFLPGGSYYQSTVAGTHSACLVGPGSADFDLYLEKWSGSKWVQVAKSEGASASEKISYNGTAGYYRYRVMNPVGVGSYSLTYSKP
ncbi:PKD domain-containing protein [Massilia sp. W12]|uniref:PKD domain-containing protein n=1 Tax=Massilia sp. W12 TaxID=3126507 RepID=UPI0030D4F7E2